MTMELRTKKTFLVLAVMMAMYYARFIGWMSLFGGILMLFFWYSVGAHNSGRYALSLTYLDRAVTEI